MKAKLEDILPNIEVYVYYNDIIVVYTYIYVYINI